MTEPGRNNNPAEPPPSYDDAIAGAPPSFQGQAGPYPPYPMQEGFKYDGVAPYPTQPEYPGQTGYPGPMPYPTQPGPYPYGAPPGGSYPPPPPGTAAYNPQGGVTFVNRNPVTGQYTDMQRRRRIFLFIFAFVAISLFIYFLTRMFM